MNPFDWRNAEGRAKPRSPGAKSLERQAALLRKTPEQRMAEIVAFKKLSAFSAPIATQEEDDRTRSIGARP